MKRRLHLSPSQVNTVLDALIHTSRDYQRFVNTYPRTVAAVSVQQQVVNIEKTLKTIYHGIAISEGKREKV